MGDLATILSQKPDHYRIRFAAQGETEHVVDVFNEISGWWGFGLAQLAYELHGQTRPVRLRVNSPGGDAMQGIAIRNFLLSYAGPVTVEVLGLAASAASVVLTGADRVEVHAGSFVMIHNPYTLAGGTAADLRHDADVLQKMEEEFAALYVADMTKRGKAKGANDAESTSQVKAWMDAETWFTAAEAVQFGFADAVVGEDAATQAATEQAIAAATRTQFFAKAKFNAAPVAVQNTVEMSTNPDKKGLLASAIAAITALVSDAETQPDAAPATEPAEDESPAVDINAARAALEAAGYTVGEPDAEEPNAESEPEETFTAADVEVRVQAALATAAATRAAKPAFKGDGSKPPVKANTRDLLAAAFAKKLEPLARALRG